MITDTGESYIVDAGRHTHPNSIWVCETTTGRVRYIPVSSAAWIDVVCGPKDVFVVHHHAGDALVALTVRPIASPDAIIAQLRRDNGSWRFTGDTSIWRELPHAYWDEHTLFLVDADRQVVDRQELDWLDSSAYDLGTRPSSA